MQKTSKTIFLITIVLVSLICLTAASAVCDDAVIAGDSMSAGDIVAAESDVAVTAIEDAQTVDDTNAYDDTSYEADDVIANSSGDTSKGALGSSLLGDANTKTFSQLADDISSNPAMLSGAYYKYDADVDSAYVEGISLTNGLTIIGGGATIDGSNLARIFVIPEGVSVTIMNVNLINGAADEGAAIYNSGKLTLVGSKINDNIAVKSGAGIYNDKGELLATSCEFDGNDLTDRTVNGWGGAAIYSNEGTVTLSEVNVTNNLKNIVHRGGTGAYTGDLSSAAVTSVKGTLTVTDSYFVNNSGSYGGAILANGAGTLLVSGTTFDNNFAFNGGAIDISGTDYTITDSKFYNNDAKGTGSSQTNYAHGGAICAQDADNQGLISGCDFENNTATIGGAISSSNTAVTDSNFTNNNANAANSENFNGKVNSKGGFGGAIFNDETITIDNSNFTDNIGRGRGLDLKNAEISDSSFTNTIINVNNKGSVEVSNNQYDNDGKDISSGTGCTVVVNVEDGDAPYVTGGTILFNGDMTFQDLQDIINAGNTAITLGGNVIKADDEVDTFANGITISNSVTIYGNEKTITAATGKIFNVAEGKTLTLSGNTLLGSGEAAIANYGTLSLSLASPNTFTNCGETPIDNQGRTSQTGLTTFTQLSNLIALVNGGEVYIGSSKITKANGESEIVIDKDIAVTGFYSSVYKRIDTVLNANNDGRAFTVAEGKTLTINNINITNGAADKGAGIYVSEGAALNANNVSFLNNVADFEGGAIYAVGDLTVIGSTFANNSASQGGAIYVDPMYAEEGVVAVSIKDSAFTDNTAGNGGAISDYYGSEMTIGNCAFTKNIADEGGAIFSQSSLLNISDSNFTENSAPNGEGGAIEFTGENVTIAGCNFTKNSAGANAGAFSHRGNDEAVISDCTFTENTASDGGAIDLFYGKITIDQCTFTKNAADYGGAIANIAGDYDVTVKDSTFTDNTATEKGNAIYNSEDCVLSLEGNTISTTSVDIENWGFIESKVISVILSNDTYNWHIGGFLINATLTDDNGNIINDNLFKFRISKEGSEDILVPATFNADSGYYQGTFTPDIAGDYLISIDYPVAEVETSVLKVFGSLSDLANLISNDNDGIIELGCDYSYIAEFDAGLESGIVIDDEITINGNGYTISGSDAARIFNVTENGVFTLNEVTLANGKADDGAAVYLASDAKLDATSTTFKDNVATYSGGAIYTEGGEIVLTDSLIDNNDVTDVSKNNGTGGAAIYAENAQVTLVNTNVTNNGRRELDRTNDDLVDAVLTLKKTDAEITGGLFENNTGIYGGAIMSTGDGTQTLTITGATFNDNKAYDGGAIYIGDMITTISGSTFTNNIVVGPGSTGYYAAGGAIVADGNGSFALSDSTFTGNKATGEGAWAGAVGVGLTTNNSASITGCTFTENTADDKGDSIYNHGYLSLSGNTLDSYIVNYGQLNSQVNIVINGNTTYTMEAFDIFNAEVRVTDDNGNVIRVNGDKIGMVAYCYAVAGSVPKPVFDEATGLYKSSFSVTKSGVINMGNLRVTFPYVDAANVVVNSSYVTVIPVDRILEVTYDNITYPGNLTVSVKVTREKDGAVVSPTVKITIGGVTKSISTKNGVGNVTFEGLLADDYIINASIAGTSSYNAVEQLYDLTVFEKQGTFKDLQERIDNAEAGSTINLAYDIAYDAEYDGDDFIDGIIVNKSIVVAGAEGIEICGKDLARVFKVTDGATLTLNDVTVCDGAAEKGAGVYVDAGAALNAKNVTFIDNVAVKRGGAIYSEGTVNIDVAVFDKNDITLRSKNDDNGGAAIYNNGGTLDVNNANITNNLLDIVIRDGNDGHLVNAVVFTNGDTTITDSYFANNTGSWGAGIYVTGDATLTVKNTTFEGNNATFGASIYDEGAKIIVDNCTFNDNKGLGVGSAGTSSTQAGAILVMSSGASATITDSKFNRNSANIGGAISVSQATGDVLIECCEFTDNTASNEGGAIYNYAADGATLTVKDSIFTDNTANNWGDAISNDAALKLEGNTITGGRDAAIGNWLGTIDSKVCSTILANDTYNWHMDGFVINATLTDDNGNLINDHLFNFVISKEGSDDVVVPATFYTSLGYYQGTFTPSSAGDYLISIDYPVAEVETSVVKISRSLTDLANMIASDEDGVIELDGDYSYIPEFDESLAEGIVIDKLVVINGNNYVINGSDTARLFHVTAGTLTLNNVTICDGAAEKGAGVYVDAGAELVADNVVFTENVAVKRGGAIYSEGAVEIKDSVIDSNDVTFRSANDDNGGAAIYNLGGTLSLDNVNVTNNLKDIVIRDGNDGHLINGAIVSTGTATVTNSYFANNTGSWGGAIYLPSSGTLDVSNTVFEGNNATFGAAIYDEGGAIVVDNCTFNDNAAVGIGSAGTSNTQGGAILVMSSGVADIKNSRFNRNSAKIGGAVSFAGSKDSAVTNCNFTDNTAEDGGAIYLWTQDDAAVTVKDSTFSGNTAGWGNAISTDGALKLEGNTISTTSADVANWAGSIESTVYAVLIDGQEIAAALGEEVTPTAKLTDDNGNLIRDSTFKITVNGQELETSYADGIYTATYTIETAGDNVVSTNYDAVLTEGKYVVEKEDATLTVTVSQPVKYGDNATVSVTLTGINGIGLNETIKVVVNNMEYPVEIIDGAGEFNVSDLESGDYAALGIFESQNYNTAYATGTFTVLDTGAELSVVIEDTTYGSDAVINVALTDKDGNGLNGIVKVFIGEDEYLVPVVNGEGSLAVSGLAADDYAYVAEFIGDNTYAPVTQEEKTFKVKQAQSSIAITAPGEIVFGDALTIGTELSSNGQVISGDVVVVVTDASGNVFEDLTKLPAGEYTINATFAGDDNYLGTEATAAAVVKPASSSVSVSSIAEIKEGKTQEIVIAVDPEVEGTVKVIVTGEGYRFEKSYAVSELASSIQLTDLAVGEYHIDVEFTPDANYETSTASAGFTVVPKDESLITITPPGEIVYGDALTVGTELTSGGQVISGDVVVVVTDASGNVFEDLTKLPAGVYTINATFAGNDEYAATEATATVVVKQASAIVTIIAPGEIVYGDALTVGTELTSGGQAIAGTVDVVVTDTIGTVFTDLSKLDVGTYTITASFAGNDNYLGDEAVSTVVVKQASSSVAVSPIAEINVGETQKITIVVGPEGADGTVKVIVTGDGYSFSKEYSVYELAEPVTLEDLSEGAYSIDVIFDAGDNYGLSTASAGFTVKSTDVSAKVNSTFINFGENVTVTIEGMPEDVPATDLNITDNGKEIAVTLNGNEFVYTPAESGEHVIAIKYNGTAYDKFYTETGFTVAPEGEYTVIPANNSAEAVQEAINNAPAGATIKLADNTTYDLTGIELNNNVTIAGGEGTVITVPAGQSSAFVAAANASAVNIRNVKFVATSDNQSLLSVTPNNLGGGISQVPAITIENVTAIPAAGVNESTISLLNANTKANPFKPSSDVSISKNIMASGVSSLKTNASALSGNVALKKAVKTTLSGKNTQKVYAIPYKAAKSGKYYSVTLKDANGKVLAGKNVKFTLAGKTYTVKTNSKGVAKLAINIYKPGTYKLAISFAGESTLGASSKQAKIKILKNKVKITRKTKKVKRSKKKRTLKYYVKTKTGKKMGIKGVKVYLKINKKTYKAKTNKKGLVKFKVKLPRVKKTYKVKVTFKGNKANKKRTLKTKVKVY